MNEIDVKNLGLIKGLPIVTSLPELRELHYQLAQISLHSEPADGKYSLGQLLITPDAMISGPNVHSFNAARAIEKLMDPEMLDLVAAPPGCSLYTLAQAIFDVVTPLQKATSRELQDILPTHRLKSESLLAFTDRFDRDLVVRCGFVNSATNDERLFRWVASLFWACHTTNYVAQMDKCADIYGEKQQFESIEEVYSFFMKMIPLRNSLEPRK